MATRAATRSPISSEAALVLAEVRRVLCGTEGTVMYLAEVSYRCDYIYLEMDLKP